MFLNVFLCITIHFVLLFEENIWKKYQKEKSIFKMFKTIDITFCLIRTVVCTVRSYINQRSVMGHPP